MPNLVSHDIEVELIPDRNIKINSINKLVLSNMFNLKIVNKKINFNNVKIIILIVKDRVMHKANKFIAYFLFCSNTMAELYIPVLIIEKKKYSVLKIAKFP